MLLYTVPATVAAGAVFSHTEPNSYGSTLVYVDTWHCCTLHKFTTGVYNGVSLINNSVASRV